MELKLKRSCGTEVKWVLNKLLFNMNDVPLSLSNGPLVPMYMYSRLDFCCSLEYIIKKSCSSQVYDLSLCEILHSSAGLEHPTGVRKVMGSNPVRTQIFFFVPRLWQTEYGYLLFVNYFTNYQVPSGSRYQDWPCDMDRQSKWSPQRWPRMDSGWEQTTLPWLEPPAQSGCVYVF